MDIYMSVKLTLSELKVNELRDWVMSGQPGSLMHMMEHHLRAKLSRHWSHPIALLY